MKDGSELDWLEEPPWWKKTLKWFAWLALSVVAAAGLSHLDQIARIAGFVSVWVFRNRLKEPKSQTAPFWLCIVLLGVGFATANLLGHGNDLFWKGFVWCFGLLGGLVIFPLMQNSRELKDKLEFEIYYSQFDWYRKQRKEKAVTNSQK